MTIELAILNSSKEKVLKILGRDASIENCENHEKEYAMKSDFMKQSLKSLQKYIILDLVKCGVIGYFAWVTYKTNGEWVKQTFLDITDNFL